MAKRENDGTIPLAKANAEAKLIDRANSKEMGGAKAKALRAVSAAFASPLEKRRVRKPARAVAMA